MEDRAMEDRAMEDRAMEDCAMEDCNGRPRASIHINTELRFLSIITHSTAKKC